MQDKVEKMNYMLAERLSQLPLQVYNKIRDDFFDLPKTNRHRWYQIRKDKVNDLRAREALVFTENIGCTLGELLNPSIDLQPIYIERVQKPEQDEMAGRFGLHDI